MRLEFDYKSRQGIKGVEYKETKKLTAREIAQIRYMVRLRQRTRGYRQLIILLISIAVLALLVWGFIAVFQWFASQPADIYNPNAR